MFKFIHLLLNYPMMVLRWALKGLNFPWGEFKCPKGGGKAGVGVEGDCKKITDFSKSTFHKQ